MVLQHSRRELLAIAGQGPTSRYSLPRARRGELGSILALHQAIRARYGVHTIEERMHRLCTHCAHYDDIPVSAEKLQTVCERLLCPLTLDGSDCPYFTEAKPEVPFVPEP